MYVIYVKTGIHMGENENCSKLILWTVDIDTIEWIHVFYNILRLLATNEFIKTLNALWTTG